MLDINDLDSIKEIIKPLKESLNETQKDIGEIKKRLNSIEFRLTNIESWMETSKVLMINIEEFMKNYVKRTWTGKLPEDIITDFEKRLKIVESAINNPLR